MESIPHTPYALIDQLDKEFPARCARKGMSQEDIWLEAGARSVVEMLLRVRAEENENILSKTNVPG